MILELISEISLALVTVAIIAGCVAFGKPDNDITFNEIDNHKK
jgi:hypothetical protein